MFRLEKNFFVEGPPTLVKGKIFDTRFGLIHVQTGKKFFCRGTPPPPLAMATRWAVCLLRSRRRTFLYELFMLTGFQFFQIEAKLLLGKIVQRFNIHIDPTQSFEVMETTSLKPKDGCRCALSLREK